MNFCTKCQSIYSQPGTCNCFATQQPHVPSYSGVPVAADRAVHPVTDDQPTLTPNITWGVTDNSGGTSITVATPAPGEQSCNLSCCRGECGICS